MQTGRDDRVAVIVEDDADIRMLLAEVLEQAGFTTFSAANGADGVEAVRVHNPVLTTLDVSMPGIDGFETAKRIRTFSATYIVMLTARTDEIDAIQGLEAGADDYITKPFRPRELRARIEAMLRRPRATTTIAEASPSPAAEPDSAAHPDAPLGRRGWLEHNGLRLQPGMRLARLGDAELSLTRSEFDILVALLESGRTVLSKNELALSLRGERNFADFVSDADARAIEVHVANLRRKLGEQPAHPRWIETVRGVGYRLTESDGS